MDKSVSAEEVKKGLKIEEVIANYTDIVKSGNDFKGCCPFHGEKTASFLINTSDQYYYCFGCGASGDVFDFIMEFTGCSFKEALANLSNGKSLDFERLPVRAESEKVNPYQDYIPVFDAPARIESGDSIDLANPKRDGKVWKDAKTEIVTPYVNPDGSLFCYVVRLRINGVKQDPSIMWCERPDGSSGWTRFPFGDELPLANLDRISREDAQVVIGEGEKVKDCLEKNLPEKLIASCWPGGTRSINKVNFSPLKNKNVVYLMDRDDPGLAAAIDIKRISKEVGFKTLKIIVPESDRKKGWDIADRKWKRKNQLLAWIKERFEKCPDLPEYFDDPEYFKKNAAKPDVAEMPPAPPEDAYSESAGQPPEPPPQEPGPPEPPEVREGVISHRDHFHVLGYHGDHFYFMPVRSGQVIAKTAGGLSNFPNLLTLAPRHFWEQWLRIEPGKKISQVQMEQTTDQLISQAYGAGLFDFSKVRGRGAWIDDGRNVLHCGQHLYVDGAKTEIKDFETKFVYSIAFDVGITYTEPASSAEANELIQISESLSWESSLSAPLLAGWCVVSPLCGMLDWRPHIWVTGPSGSGKSTVVKEIIQVLTRDIGLRIEGGTSEAGIRQELREDARPILIDEAETESETEQRKMAEILRFARISSSGGKILKGSTLGKPVNYSARSSFCFSSINTSIKEGADESRITKLILKKDSSKGVDYWDELSLKIIKTITPTYANRMLSRSIKYMDVLQFNINTFRRAASHVFSNARIADQVGTLLAGTYLCYSAKKIEFDAAVEWIKTRDWSDHTIINSSTDPEKLLQKICSHRITVEGAQSRHDITVGEAIENVLTEEHPGSARFSHEELKRNGIKIDVIEGKKYAQFANSSESISFVLRNTPWASAWARPLGEIAGSVKVKNAVRFTPAVVSRAVAIPESVFVN